MRTCCLCGKLALDQPCDPCMTQLHTDAAQLRTDITQVRTRISTAAHLACLAFALSVGALVAGLLVLR